MYDTPIRISTFGVNTHIMNTVDLHYLYYKYMTYPKPVTGVNSIYDSSPSSDI